MKRILSSPNEIEIKLKELTDYIERLQLAKAYRRDIEEDLLIIDKMIEDINNIDNSTFDTSITLNQK